MNKLPLQSIFRRSQKCQRGAAAVEFAIVISLLVMIMGGIFEFGRVIWYLDALTKATRDGARFMSTVANTSIANAAAATANNPPYTAGNPLTVRSIVVNAASAANVSNVSNVAPVLTYSQISVSCDNGTCTNGTAPQYITVSVAFPVTIGSWFPIPLHAGTWTLKPHTTMRYMCAAGVNTSC